ncbi:hypothetical protein V1358_16000 [Pseudoalteromonas sp. YIC-656]|uniref:hypothetical protein n=1 Tax=Pseudoalteromonas pernae TaxID=3118054 RepID=UPI0032425E53
MKKWILAASLIPQLCLANASDAMSLYLDQQYEEAFSLFEQTAELGDGRSQFNLAVQYLRGQGVPADPVKAYAYFSVAIANEFKMAEQARKSAERRLKGSQLTQAKELAEQLIARYGPSGSQSIEYELSRTLSYNPTREKTVNPPTEYPSALQSEGAPGMASLVFDIDKNGIPRDYMLLNSYPAPEFAESMLEKLQQTRFVRAEKPFKNGIIRGVFAGLEDSEVTQRLHTHAQQLLKLAKRDDVAAQAELATVLQLLDDAPQHFTVSPDMMNIVSVAPEINFQSITQPQFSKQETLESNFFNFGYLVNVTDEGKVEQWQAFEHVDIPEELTKHAQGVMSSWQLSAKGAKLKEDNWYYAHFFYNNKAQEPQYLNHNVSAYVDLQPVVTKEPELQWRYWQHKAAVGGHSDTLFQLGVNCNVRLLSIAANQAHTRSQLQLGKCLLDRANESETFTEQAKFWLQKAADAGNLIAMRKLAGWYVRYSDNGADLNYAIELAEQVVDANDHPMAYAYLAAAHAKLGNFEEAISYQQQAVEEADDQAFDQQPLQQTLAAYKDGRLVF